MAERRRVVFVCSPEQERLADAMPAHPHRSSAVNGLLAAYGLLDKMAVVAPQPASWAELITFHDASYLRALQHCNESDASACREAGAASDDDSHSCEDGEDMREHYGLNDDRAPGFRVFDYARLVGGGSLQAARMLRLGEARVVVHWEGGRHHAQPSRAAGFCFVNDVVLAIGALLESGAPGQRFARVLCLDLDVHHGDAVEQAFVFSPSVLTASLHQYDPPLFFPGSGPAHEVGRGKGTHASLNVPLRRGMRDASYSQLLDALLPALFDSFEPQAVVLLFGADALAGDRLGGLNLTTKPFVRALECVLARELPTLVLGGGGYHVGHANTARLWTMLTATCLGVQDALSEAIPDAVDNIEAFAPHFGLSVLPLASLQALKQARLGVR